MNASSMHANAIRLAFRFSIPGLMNGALLCLSCLCLPVLADELPDERIVYKEVDGQTLSAHVFQPANRTHGEQASAMAFFHGGGWAFGKPDEFFAICRRYAELGLVAVAFDYRLSIQADGSVPHPDITPIESVEDARSAMRWMRSNANKLKIDPDRIVAVGQSAGGQLALATALLDGMNADSDDLAVSPEPNALVLYSSSVNTIEPWLEHLLGERRERIWDLSPYHNLKPGMPPVLAFHGTADRQVPFYTIQFFQTRMRELGNPYLLVPVEGSDHYLGGDRNTPYAGYVDEAILERSDAFLREHGFLPSAIR